MIHTRRNARSVAAPAARTRQRRRRTWLGIVETGWRDEDARLGRHWHGLSRVAAEHRGAEMESGQG